MCISLHAQIGNDAERRYQGLVGIYYLIIFCLYIVNHSLRTLCVVVD